MIPIIKNALQTQLKLILHPNKIYLLHYSKGVQFLGGLIKPQRIYIANPTKGNSFAAIEKQNALLKTTPPNDQQQAAFLSSLFSSSRNVL